MVQQPRPGKPSFHNIKRISLLDPTRPAAPGAENEMSHGLFKGSFGEAPLVERRTLVVVLCDYLLLVCMGVGQQNRIKWDAGETDGRTSEF